MIDQCQCCGSEIRRYKGVFKSGQNYILSQDNRTITKCCEGWNATAIGSEPIPLGTITIIKFKIEKTDQNSYIMIGIAPQSIDQKLVNGYSKCGWYLYTQNGGLYCQPPLSYGNFQFIKENHLPEGTIITLIVDTNIGKISYKINDSLIKTAYQVTFPESIVPCVLPYTKGDSVRILQN